MTARHQELLTEEKKPCPRQHNPVTAAELDVVRSMCCHYVSAQCVDILLRGMKSPPGAQLG